MRTKTPSLSVLLLLWGLLLPWQMHAQSPVWGVAFQVPAKGVSLHSIDRFDRIYVTDARQNVLQIDTLGRVLSHFSPPLQGHVAMVEAWSPAKISVFYDDRQRVQLLDRFLTPLSEADLRNYTDGTIRAVTLAADDRLWLFDETTFRLLKVDTRYTSIVHETPLELVFDREAREITFLREYQGKVYLVDRQEGIYVFDNLGNYQKKIPIPRLSYVGFLGDELYYLANNQLHFLHLYNLLSRTVALPESTSPYRQALVGDNYLYLLNNETIFAYRWQ